MNNKVCILGAAGFIGSHLVQSLLKKNYEINFFDRNCGKNLKKHNINFFGGDFLVKDDVLKALKGCDTCFHLLNTNLPAESNNNPLQDAQENIIGTIQLLDCLKESNVKRIIYASSAGTVYGATQENLITEEHSTYPICAYGVSKITNEKYINLYSKLYGIEYSCLRITNPYGPLQEKNKTQGVIGNFLHNIANQKDIEIWGDGSIVRDFIFIDDVIDAFIAALNCSEKKVIVNIGSGIGHSILDIIEIIKKCTNLNPNIIFKDKREFDVQKSTVSTQKSKLILKWEPKTSINSGILQTWEAMLKVNK